MVDGLLVDAVPVVRGHGYGWVALKPETLDRLNPRSAFQHVLR